MPLIFAAPPGQPPTESRWIIHSVIIGCALLLALPYWMGHYQLPKTEDFEYSIIPTILYSKQIFSALGPAWWNPQIGLGSPWPIPSSIIYSPFNVLFNYTQPFQTIGIIIFTHSCFLGYSSLLFFRRMGLYGPTLTVALFSLLLSTAIEYLYWSDAIIVYTTWSVVPFLFLATDVALNDPPPKAWTAASALGLVGGYMALNGHLGVLSIYLIGLFVFVISQTRQFYSRSHLFLFAGLTAALIGAEKILFILNETSLFPPSIPRDQQGLHGGIIGLFQNSLLRPFFLPTSLDLSKISNFLSHFAETNSFSRTVGFGSSFTICTVFYLFSAFRNKSSLKQDSKLQSQLTVLIASLLLLFWPLAYLPSAISATWPLRDLIHLFGILLAGKFILLLAAPPKQPAPRFNKPQILLFAQVAVIALNALAMVQGANWLSTRGKVEVSTYSDFTDPAIESPYVHLLRQGLSNHSSTVGRVIATGQASHMMDIEMLADQGVINNFSILSGFSEVSFIAKGISFDTIRPGQSVPYGIITGDRLVRWQTQDALPFDWVRDEQPLLSLLGIDLVIAAASETVTAANLSLIGSLIGKDGYSVSIYKNTKPLPLAFSVPNSILEAQPSTRANCINNHSLYCLSVSPIVENADGSKIKFIAARDNIRLNLSGDITTRKSILISSMYRPSWQLSDKTRQAGVSLENWNGLILVKVPPNVSHIEINYHPKQLIVARQITTLSSLASLAIFGLLLWRRK